MIRRDDSSREVLVLTFPDGRLEENYSTIAGTLWITEKIDSRVMAETIRDWIYSKRDRTFRVNQLPNDDPMKTTDPASEMYFWRGSGGQKVLVKRQLVVSVKWDGKRFQYGFRAASR